MYLLVIIRRDTNRFRIAYTLCMRGISTIRLNINKRTGRLPADSDLEDGALRCGVIPMKVATIVILAQVAIAKRGRNHVRDLPFNTSDALVSRVLANARVGIPEDRPFFRQRDVCAYADDGIPPALGGVDVTLSARQ